MPSFRADEAHSKFPQELNDLARPNTIDMSTHGLHRLEFSISGDSRLWNAIMVTHRRIEFLLLAVLLVYASHAIPSWLVYEILRGSDGVIRDAIGTANWHAVLSLVFSLVLIAHDPQGYGVRIGQVRDKWLWLLLLCLVPIALTYIVYPRLAVKPFSGGPISIWLISPLAQDLLFAGYFYEKFSHLFPGKISERVPVERTVFVTAFYFSLWHTPGLASGLGAFIWFQLIYTYFGACLVGLIRQWTGSFLYITLVHMAVNLIAVRF